MKMCLKLFKKDRPPKIEFRKAFTLTVYFCRPKRGNLLSRLPQLLLRMPYSHVAFGFKNHIFDAADASGIWTTLKRFMVKNKVFSKYDIQLNRDQWINMLADCKVAKKTPFTFRNIFSLLSKKSKQPVFCTELAETLLQELGLTFERLNPKILERIIKAGVAKQIF